MRMIPVQGPSSPAVLCCEMIGSMEASVGSENTGDAEDEGLWASFRRRGRGKTRSVI